MSEATKIHPEALKVHISVLQQLLFARTNLIITISGLIMGILVLASFSRDIIEVTCSLKVLIVILLALLPITILDYLLKIGKAETKIYNKIADEISRKEMKEKSLLKKLIDGSVYLYAVIFSVIILVAISLISKSVGWTLLIAFIDSLIIFVIYKYSE